MEAPQVELAHRLGPKMQKSMIFCKQWLENR